MSGATGCKARDAFVRIVSDALSRSDKTLVEIAARVGFANSNVLTMIRQGKTRVPPDKVAALADALGIDPSVLLRAWMDAYMPETLADLQRHPGAILAADEAAWLRFIATSCGGTPPLSREAVAHLHAAAKALPA